jgi:hypothetical protein
MMFLGLTGPLIAPSVAAQGLSPCALLTAEEIQTIVPKEHMASGVARAVSALDSFGCRFTWGAGTGHFTLDVAVNPASRMFAGMSADAAKQALLSSVIPGTSDAVVPDIGEAAVFKVHSPLYANVSAYVKNRVLQVSLDGIDAPDWKAELISLLKSAASRL